MTCRNPQPVVDVLSTRAYGLWAFCPQCQSWVPAVSRDGKQYPVAHDYHPITAVRVMPERVQKG